MASVSYEKGQYNTLRLTRQECTEFTFKRHQSNAYHFFKRSAFEGMFHLVHSTTFSKHLLSS